MFNENLKRNKLLEQDSIIFETHHPYYSFYLYHSTSKDFDEIWQTQREKAIDTIKYTKIYPIKDDFQIDSIKNKDTNEYLMMMFRFDWEDVLDHTDMAKYLYLYIVYKERKYLEEITNFLNMEFYNELIVKINTLYRKELFYFSPPFFTFRDNQTEQIYLVRLFDLENIFNEEPFKSLKLKSVRQFTNRFDVEMVVFYYLNKFDTSKKFLNTLYQKSSQIPFHIHHLKKKFYLEEYLANEYDFLFGYCFQKIKIEFSLYDFKTNCYFLDVIDDNDIAYHSLINLLTNSTDLNNLYQNVILFDPLKETVNKKFLNENFYYLDQCLMINSLYVRFLAYKEIKIEDYKNWEEIYVSRKTVSTNTTYFILISKEFIEDEENNKEESNAPIIDLQKIFVSRDINDLLSTLISYIKLNEQKLLTSN